MPTWRTVFTGHLLIHTPFLLVCAAGLMVTLLRRRRQPRQVLLVVSALALFVLTVVGRAFVQSWLPYEWARSGWSADEIAHGQELFGPLSSLIQAVALALLLVAAFAGPKEPPPTPTRPARS